MVPGRANQIPLLPSEASQWKREIVSAAPSGRSLKLQGTKRKEDNLLFLLLLPLFALLSPNPPSLQTKDALLSILNDLRPADRFNLVGFSNKVKVWQPGRLLPVTPLNIRDAKKFIFTLPTTGGQRSPVHLSVCPNFYLVVCPSIISPSVHLLVCQFICVIRVSVYLSVHLSPCLPVCLSIRPSVCTSIYLPVLPGFYQSIFLHQYVCLCTCLFICWSIHYSDSVHLSTSHSNQHQLPCL